MDIVRLFGRPWDTLVAEFGEAELLAWHRVYLNPSGERPKPAPSGPPRRRR